MGIRYVSTESIRALQHALMDIKLGNAVLLTWDEEELAWTESMAHSHTGATILEGALYWDQPVAQWKPGHIGRRAVSWEHQVFIGYAKKV